MIKGYETKDMKAPEETKMAPPEQMEDGAIFEKDGMFFFKWKGGECGYGSREAAETVFAELKSVFDMRALIKISFLMVRL